MLNRSRLIEQFMSMVKIGSESFHEARFRDYLQEEFSKRGLKAEEDNAARQIGGDSGNLLIRVPGTVDIPPLLLTAHMDTVGPGQNIEPIRADDKCIRSAGKTILASDDKAGIAAILEAVDVLIEEEKRRPPLEILITACEEQGLLGARNFDYTKLQAKMGYTLDSDGSPGGIVVASPCQNEIDYVVHGRAAHAGMNPEDGINAIQVMARAIAKMPCGRIDEETTCNFGLIDGGSARNIVAEYCHVKGEARSLNPSKLDSLTEELKKIFTTEVEACGARAEIEVSFLYPAVALDTDEPLIRQAVKAAEKIGLTAELKKTGGGSDAAVIHNHGIRCANLAIGMSSVHTTAEYIQEEDLVNTAKWLLAIIDQYVGEAAV